ncbi:MAG: hypothetical protein WC428_01915 [Candidatus Paceibacterota bacterium]
MKRNNKCTNGLKIPTGLKDSTGNVLNEGDKVAPFTYNEIQKFKAEWKQTHTELCDAMGFSRKHNESDELLVGDYFWIEADKKWYPKTLSLYTKREQAIADCLRNNE